MLPWGILTRKLDGYFFKYKDVLAVFLQSYCIGLDITQDSINMRIIREEVDSSSGVHKDIREVNLQCSSEPYLG